MHLAVSSSDLETWLALNTTYCSRHHARLTAAACAKNREQSAFDLRCEGCGGLEKQVPPPHPALRLIPSVPSDIHPVQNVEGCPVEILEQRQDPDVDQADELLLWAAECLPDSLDHIESFIPGLTSEIIALVDEAEAQTDFAPDESLLDETACRDRRTRTVKSTRFLVFTGRCARCDGYMAYDPDRQFEERDHDTYHCLACGWRTSPTYEFNRKP